MPNEKWDLSGLSAGERACLRRCAGQMPGSNMQAMEVFYKALSGKCRPGAENAWFACMCMECLWREQDHAAVKPFEEIAGSIYRNPDATDSTRHRCTAYMDLPWGEDGFLLSKLCRLVRMMRSSNASVMPDFEKMADDLSRWNSADHSVQRRWIRTICFRNEETKPAADTAED